MTVHAAQLLKQLEPAVRPVPSTAPGANSRASIEATGFDQLLQMAAKGGIHSGRQIEVKFDSASAPSASQLERMAAAADCAEAAGFKRALLLIDGRAFVLDVASRSLVAEMSGGEANSVQPIDGAISVASTVESSIQGLNPSDAGVASAKLLEQLRAAPARSAATLTADQFR